MKAQTAASAKRKPYGSDLADAQREILEPMLQPPKTDLREVVNALRTLPAHAPPRPADAADRLCLLQNVEVRRDFEANPRRPPRRSPLAT